MKVTDSKFDFSGLPARRLFANFLRWKIMPFGYLERGPGIVWLLSIWARHQFGYRLAWLQIKHKKQFDRARFVLGLLRQGQWRALGKLILRR